MRGKRFEENRPGRDVCHQHYVRTAKSGTVSVSPNLGQAEYGTTIPGSNPVLRRQTVDIIFILHCSSSLSCMNA